MLFAFTDSPGKALLVIAVYTFVQQVEGNLTTPVVMARTVKLHPAVIAVGVLVVGQLFGFVGLVVAVPILSMITILVEELWVKPIEEGHRTRTDDLVALPAAVDASREVEDGPEARPQQVGPRASRSRSPSR